MSLQHTPQTQSKSARIVVPKDIEREIKLDLAAALFIMSKGTQLNKIASGRAYEAIKSYKLKSLHYTKNTKIGIIEKIYRRQSDFFELIEDPARPNLCYGNFNEKNFNYIIFALEAYHNEMAAKANINFEKLDFLKRGISIGKQYISLKQRNSPPVVPAEIPAPIYNETIPRIVQPSQLRLSTLLNPLGSQGEQLETVGFYL